MSSEVLATFLAGIVVPFAVGWIKRVGLSGPGAAWLAFGVSVAVACFVLLATGGYHSIPLDDPAAAVAALTPLVSAIYALSQLIYNQFKDRLPGLEGTKKLAGLAPPR